MNVQKPYRFNAQHNLAKSGQSGKKCGLKTSEKERRSSKDQFRTDRLRPFAVEIYEILCDLMI